MDRALREAIILDYARVRQGYGLEQRTDAVAGAHPAVSAFREVHRRNPLCGDEVTVRLEFTESRPTVVARLRWEGRGCTVSQASAAMLAVRAEGMTPADLLALSHEVRELIVSPEPMEGSEAVSDEAPDVAALAGIGRLPLRARCAALAWDALDAALAAEAQPSGGPLSDPDRAPS